MRPLLGGYHAWKDLGYPLEEVAPPVEAAGTEGRWREEWRKAVASG